MTERRLNEHARWSSGRELIISRRKSDEFATDPGKRCDVELKCLFRASGSALIGWGLGRKKRCIVFHSSLDLLDDRALFKKARLTDLILVLILLRTTRNLFQTLAEFVLCAKYLSTFRSLWSFLISSLLNQGAGVREIVVIRRGACLSRQDLKGELRMFSFSLGSSRR